jgi:hypothetical protein
LNSPEPSLLSHISLSMESVLLISSAMTSQGNGGVTLDSDFTGSKDQVMDRRVGRLPSNHLADLLVNVRCVIRW